MTYVSIFKEVSLFENQRLENWVQEIVELFTHFKIAISKMKLYEAFICYFLLSVNIQRNECSVIPLAECIN